MSPRIDGNTSTGGARTHQPIPIPTAPIARDGADIATRVAERQAQRATRAFRLLDPTEPDRVYNPVPQVTTPAPARTPRTQSGHGTMSGYRQHYRHGTTPCAECRAANAAVHRARRSRLRDGAPPKKPTATFDVTAALTRIAAGESIRSVARAFGVSNPAMQHHVKKWRANQEVS